LRALSFISFSSRNQQNLSRRQTRNHPFGRAGRSIYRWQGKIETATEVVLIAKSRAALFEEIEKRITELHPYDCPCLVAWPIEAGHQPYLDWLGQETAS
jgi:uncharacterized protein involved in tolerance to divalent cations